MNVTETLNEGLKREFKIVVGADEIEAQMDAKLKEIAPQVNLPGFRPGKVPPALLRSRYGDSLLGEILDKTVTDATNKTLEERELRPAVQPKVEIDSYDKGQDLEYTVTVELMPEIEAIDFSTLQLERLTAEVSEEDLQKALERMAEQQKESTPVEEARASQNGDVVVIDFIGRVDGEAFEGGTASDHHLELGSNSFIPGFEEQLVGANAGDKKDVTVTFPEEYPAENLKGKEAVFEVTVKELREPTPVAIDDELAKRFGMDDLDALKEVLKGQMSGEFEQASRSHLKRALLDQLAERHSFEVPAGMVEEEYRGIVHQVVAHGEHSHDDGHTDHSGSAEEEEQLSEEDRQEYREIAERRVRLGMLLAEVGRQNNIDVADEEINQAIQQQASRFPGQEQFVFDYYRQNPQALAQVRAPLYEDKIVDFVLEMAEVTDKTVSAEALFSEDGEEPAAESATEEEKPKKKAASKKKSKADASAEGDGEAG